MKQKPNYYSITPATVRYDKGLKPNEKLLYGEISALANSQGCCWASNNYFAELYNVTPQTVSTWINNLKDHGYIKVKMEFHEGTKAIKRRVISLSESPSFYKEIEDEHNQNIDTKPVNEILNVKEKINRGINEMIETPIKENLKGGIKKNLKDNNTSINNTSMNTTTSYNINNIYKDAENESEDENKKIKKVLNFWQENIGLLNPYVQENLIQWCSEMNPDVVLEAVKETVVNGSTSYKYTNAILNRWDKANVKTAEDAKAYSRGFKNKRNDNDSHEYKFIGDAPKKGKGEELPESILKTCSDGFDTGKWLPKRENGVTDDQMRQVNAYRVKVGKEVIPWPTQD